MTTYYAFKWPQRWKIRSGGGRSNAFSLFFCFLTLNTLFGSRPSQRVLTHGDAAAIAAQTPRDPAPGSGGLPMPRSSLEAGYMVGKAREGRVYSFWAASPDSSAGDVTTHWFAQGGFALVYRKGETRCILVSSRTSTTATAMYASMEPCE